MADVSIANVISGAERVLHEQSTRLAEKGHDIHIITRRLPVHTAAYEQVEKVHEWRYPVNMTNILTFFVSTLVYSQKLFRSLCRKITFDLINFHQPFSSFPINLFQNDQTVKKVYTNHSLSFEDYKSCHRPKNRLFHPFYSLNIKLRKKIEKFNISRCKKIIVLSQFTKNKLIQNYSVLEDKICVIPGGADLNHFRFSQRTDEIKKRLKIPRDKYVLLTVRNLVPRMGIENLIRSMRIIQEQTTNIFLLIGGEGVLRDKLQNLINELELRDSVRLCGFLPEELLPFYYQAADFFVLPTVELEGFGLITVESMACGTPVLGTPVGGTKEILNLFDQSFLFKDTSPTSLAELILGKYNIFKNKPEEYEILAQKCRVFVEQNYSWKINIDRIENLFFLLMEDN